MLRTDGTMRVAGNPRSSISEISRMTNVHSVSASSYFSMVLKNDGTLWAAGKNSYGQLGNGTTEDIEIPEQIMTDVTAVSTGERHT